MNASETVAPFKHYWSTRTGQKKIIFRHELEEGDELISLLQLSRAIAYLENKKNDVYNPMLRMHNSKAIKLMKAELEERERDREIAQLTAEANTVASSDTPFQLEGPNFDEHRAEPSFQTSFISDTGVLDPTKIPPDRKPQQILSPTGRKKRKDFGMKRGTILQKEELQAYKDRIAALEQLYTAPAIASASASAVSRDKASVTFHDLPEWALEEAEKLIQRLIKSKSTASYTVSFPDY
jgi:hypothetical protein